MECEEFILSDWSPPDNPSQSERANSWIMECEEFIPPDWSPPDDPARPRRPWYGPWDRFCIDFIPCYGTMAKDLYFYLKITHFGPGMAPGGDLNGQSYVFLWIMVWYGPCDRLCIGSIPWEQPFKFGMIWPKKRAISGPPLTWNGTWKWLQWPPPTFLYVKRRYWCIMSLKYT